MSIQSIREVIAKLAVFEQGKKDLQVLQQIESVIFMMMEQHQLETNSVVIEHYLDYRLRIRVDSTTMAACLRQILPTIEAQLQQSGIVVDAIDIVSHVSPAR